MRTMKPHKAGLTLVCGAFHSRRPFGLQNTDHFFSALTGTLVTDAEAHYNSFPVRLQKCLINKISSSTFPVPWNQIYLQTCNPFRLVKELHHTHFSRRRAKLVSGLKFLRTHNVLLHGLLFFVPQTETWNTTGEFSRLRQYGEAHLHAEVKTRLLKLLPDLPHDVYVELLADHLFTEEMLSKIFDSLEMEKIVGSRPIRPSKFRIKKKAITDANSCDSKTHSNFSAEDECRIKQLQSQRKTYRQHYALTPHQKASMLCAVVGELKWFCARTKPTHRTHNNAIFPPSDVLILHVLAAHVTECIPSEMINSALWPHLFKLRVGWRNFSTSLPDQIKSHVPRGSGYQLPLSACATPDQKESSVFDPSTMMASASHSLSSLPVRDSFFSSITPTLVLPRKANSAQYRVFISARKKAQQDTLLTEDPQMTPANRSSQLTMDDARHSELLKVGFENL